MSSNNEESEVENYLNSEAERIIVKLEKNYSNKNKSLVERFQSKLNEFLQKGESQESCLAQYGYKSTSAAPEAALEQCVSKIQSLEDLSSSKKAVDQCLKKFESDSDNYLKDIYKNLEGKFA